MPDEPAVPDDPRTSDDSPDPGAAGHAAPQDAAPPDAEAQTTPRGDRAAPRRRRRVRVAVTVLSLALVAALGGAAYLGLLSHQWNERSGEWEAQSRELGQRVADLSVDLEGITGDLTSTRDQLTTAQQRITELADEKAQVGDERETQRIYASDTQAVAEAAVAVASQMGDCVTAQSTLLGYLAAPDSTTPEVLQQSTDDTNRVCSAAVQAYSTLQQDLAEQ